RKQTVEKGEDHQREPAPHWWSQLHREQTSVDVEHMKRADDENQTRHVCTQGEQGDWLSQEQGDNAPQRNYCQHSVINEADVTASPGADALAARPKNVSHS